MVMVIKLLAGCEEILAAAFYRKMHNPRKRLTFKSLISALGHWVPPRAE